MSAENALIVGAGPGLSASLARLFERQGMQVGLAARDIGKLDALCQQTGARAYSCDAANPEQVAQMFVDYRRDVGSPDIVIYNPSARVRGKITEIDPEQVRQALLVSCYGAFLVAQQASRDMLAKGSGSILFTGATAGVKGFAQSASFAMGKFGLRGLAQSMARELAPQNIHVAHFVIDGSILDAAGMANDGESRLDPDAIAEAYLFAHRQPRNAWTWEFELRPWQERF